MKLVGARVALSATDARVADLVVQDGRILSPGGLPSEPACDLSGYLLLPGLINAHDHLEFSLFPRLGNGPYPNAKTWASDIYRPSVSPVREHLSLPKAVRLLWGGVKNLLSGVTTVAHHNPYSAPVFEDNFPVRVVKRFGWAHSLDFSPDLSERYRATPSALPFILHAGEGTDDHAYAEIGRLERLGILGSRTVLVHTIGLTRQDIDLLRMRRSSIVWCPSSNLSTYGTTLSDQAFHAGLPIALGTDSALTAHADLIDEIRVATKIRRLTAQVVYNMVTAQAARILALTGGEGCIRPGGVADLIAVADSGQSPAEALQNLRPELVMVGGKIRLVAASLLQRMGLSSAHNLSRISLEGRGAWFTDVDVSSLHRATMQALGPEYRLAGRRVET